MRSTCSFKLNCSSPDVLSLFGACGCCTFWQYPKTSRGSSSGPSWSHGEGHLSQREWVSLDKCCAMLKTRKLEAERREGTRFQTDNVNAEHVSKCPPHCGVTQHCPCFSHRRARCASRRAGMGSRCRACALAATESCMHLGGPNRATGVCGVRRPARLGEPEQSPDRTGQHGPRRGEGVSVPCCTLRCVRESHEHS